MPSGQWPQQNWTRTSVSCNSGVRQEQWSAVILSSLPILCSLSSSTAVQLLDAQPSPLYREPRKFGGTPSPSSSVLKPAVHPWVVDSRPIPATQCLAGPHASMVLLNGVEDGDLRTRVRLEPFIHQVGGHAGMMRYNETTICKPLFSNELGFYQSLPAEMQAFTPRFKGLISVSLERDSSGQLVLVASPHKDNQSPAPPSPKAHRNKKTKASSPDHQEIRESPLQDRSHHDRTLGCTGRGLGSDVPFHMEDPNGNESKLSEQNSHNPWGLRCHRAQLSRMSSQGASNVLHWFVLLENVVWPFMRPCVLDLKMGTRQHGDDAPEEKKRRHMKKCEQSTSSSLGLRLGGMQHGITYYLFQCFISSLLPNSSLPRPRVSVTANMSATRYRRFLRLCEEWPKDETKKGRDLGTFLRQKVALAFREGESTQIADAEKCDQMYESLARINTNFYKQKVHLVTGAAWSRSSLERRTRASRA